MTIACGDSHTSTHGAFGAIAFGIGTSQVRDVLATGCLAMNKLKVRRIQVDGKLQKGVYAKDVILHIIRLLGINGGIGYAYEFSGDVFRDFSMEERMTVCNMAIEGGARCGYVNPDEKTIEYIRGREYAPGGDDFEKAVMFWKSVASDRDAEYDDAVIIDGSRIEPTVTWGINPGQSVSIAQRLPEANDDKESMLAFSHMGLHRGEMIEGTKIDVAFIGSCTNSRITDLREAAMIAKGKRVAMGVKALVVPGSERVAQQAKAEGLDRIFIDAGFEWRLPGCSMCLAMNPDRLTGDELCASSSNRNFIGRMGSPRGRTILMSPAMVAAAAVNGKIVDVRDYL
jgi:3-isopropylmalate/(R)-2-methylmalate dehydratase large subunit